MVTLMMPTSHSALSPMADHITLGTLIVCHPKALINSVNQDDPKRYLINPWSSRCTITEIMV